MDEQGYFVFKITFKQGTGNPRRVFDAASSFIDALQSLDRAVLPIIDNSIQSSIVLEDITAGSIRIKIANALRSVNEDALKSGDWKRVVGELINNARINAIKILESNKNFSESLDTFKSQLKHAAESSGLKHLPDCPEVDQGRLVFALDKIQRAKAELGSEDGFILELEKHEYIINISETWLPSEILNEEKIEALVMQSTNELVLTIRKPDLIKDTLWQFSHGKSTIRAAMKDYDWMDKFRSREIPILPGDALLCDVHSINSYNENGELIEQKFEIISVKKVIKGMVQDSLPLN